MHDGKKLAPYPRSLRDFVGMAQHRKQIHDAFKSESKVDPGRTKNLKFIIRLI